MIQYKPGNIENSTSRLLFLIRHVPGRKVAEKYSRMIERSLTKAMDAKPRAASHPL